MTFKDCLRRHTVLKCVLIIVTLLTSVAYMHQFFSPLLKVLLAVAGLEVLIDTFRDGFTLKCRRIWILVIFVLAYMITAVLQSGDNDLMVRSIKNALYMLMTFLICFSGSQDSPYISTREAQIMGRTAILSMLAMELTCLIVYFVFDSATYVTADGVVGYIGSIDGRLCGLVHMNVIGGMSALTIIISGGMLLFKKGGLWRMVYAFSIVCASACLVLSYSRTSILALALTLLYAYFRFYLLRRMEPVKHKKTLRILGITAGTLAFAITVSFVILAINGSLSVAVSKMDDVLTGRISIWREGLSFFAGSPLLGVTNERFAATAVFDAYPGWNGGGIHSLYIGTLMASGIIGAVILTAFTVFDILAVRKSRIIEKNNGIYALASTVTVFLLLQGLTEIYVLFSFNFFGVIYWLAMGMRRQEVDNCLAN